MTTKQELKALVTTAANNLNQRLSLKRKKDVKYTEQEYFDFLTFMSVHNSAANNSGEILSCENEVPGGAALLTELKKFTVAEVETQFDIVFVQQFKKRNRTRKRQKVIAIVDVHEQETYTKHKRTSKDVRGGKHKNGTNFFFHFVTIQVLWKEHVVTLGVRLHQRGTALRDVVNELVAYALQYVRIDVLLLDRGFCDVKLLNDLEFLTVPILMPAVMDEKAKKTLAAFGKLQRSCRFSLHNKHGEYADVRFLKVVISDEKTIGFYTTQYTFLRTQKYFLTLYAKRWTIETGYRVQKQFLAKTTSIKGSVRLFYFSYAVALHNLWLYLRDTLIKIPLRLTTLLIRVFLGSANISEKQTTPT